MTHFETKEEFLVHLLEEAQKDGTIIFVPGPKGDMPDPKDVAQALLEDQKFIESVCDYKEVTRRLLLNKEFRASLKSEDGHTPTEAELSALIIQYLPNYIPAAIPGPKPTEAELIKLLKPLMVKMKPKDGNPPSKEEIIAIVRPIIETLVSKSKSKEVVKDQSQEIEGLKKVIQDLKAVFRKKQRGGGSSGGGMGKWMHQVLNLTSSTTSVSLTHRVAGNGSVIFVRYQGQVLAHGVQYSVSGKVITLLFTPVNGTFLEVSYVRA